MAKAKEPAPAPAAEAVEQPAPAPAARKYDPAEPVALKLTSAIAIDGEIHRAGSVVNAAEKVAKDLLQRGKAVLATE